LISRTEAWCWKTSSRLETFSYGTYDTSQLPSVHVWFALQRGAMCLNHIQELSCLISIGTRHHMRCVIYTYVRSWVFVTVSWSYNVSGIFLNPTIRTSVFSRYHQLHTRRTCWITRLFSTNVQKCKKMQRCFLNQKSEGTIILHIVRVESTIHPQTISVSTNSLDLFSILPDTRSMAWRAVDMFLLLPQFARNQKECRRLPPCDIPLHKYMSSLFSIKASIFTLMKCLVNYWSSVFFFVALTLKAIKELSWIVRHVVLQAE